MAVESNTSVPSDPKGPLIVLDTNVLVGGLSRREDSPSLEILRNVQSERIPLALTHKLYLEYESVLMREEIRRLTKLSAREVKVALDALVILAQRSEVHYLWRPNLPNESDNSVLEAAIATGALIVTKNVSDFQAGELKFPDLTVMTPRQFCDQFL